MKFIWAILIALSLIGSPGAAQSAPSLSCTMDGSAEGKAVDHEKMACCTPECATPCPSAVLPMGALEHEAVEPVALLRWQPAASSLSSITPSMVDPPPRPYFA